MSEPDWIALAGTGVTSRVGVVMLRSGAGKTPIGRALATSPGSPFTVSSRHT